MSPVVRSIDLGYGFVKYVREVRTDGIECASFPSMAPVAQERNLGEALGRKRNTMTVTIDGVNHEVGPDVELVQRAIAVRHMDDDYVTSSTYLALLRGALGFMKKDAIDVLVVGLPVSMMKLRRGALERIVQGHHPLGKDRGVTVRNARVLAQPHGALLDFASGAKDARAVLKSTNLVIDCGFRTFDFLVTNGLKPVEQRSGSVPRGMYDVLREIAERIGNATGSPYYAYSKLDEALRKGRAPKIDGKDFNIDAALTAAQHLAAEAVTEMKRSLQGTNDIDNIVVVGGSAHFFKPVIESMLNGRQVVTVRDAEFSNLRGFQRAGVEWASQRLREHVAAAE